MSTRNLLTSLLGLLFALLMAPAAHASMDNCDAGQLPWTPTVVSNVAHSLSPGLTVNGSEVTNGFSITCSSNWRTTEGATCSGSPNWEVIPVSGNPIATSYPDTYRTPDMPASLGYQILNSAAQPLPLNAAGHHDTGVPIVKGSQAVILRIRIVKTGDPVVAGNFSLPLVLACGGNEWAKGTQAASTMTLNVNVKVVAQACTLTTPDLQMALPPVAAASFSGTGSTAGSVSASLSLSCDPGVDATLNFTDANQLSNTGTALALQGGSSAAGVGVQLSAQGSTVSYASYERSNHGGTRIVLQNTGSATQTQEIPLAATYVQTAESVQPGTVQARAFVNITYN